MANFYAQYPPSSSGSSSNPSIGTNGFTAPTSSTEVGGIDPSGNLQGLKVDSSGNLLVDIASPIVVSENVAQFGGNNVVTGTGASGLGIPRFTISNDSNILATQSGTWNITNISGTINLPTGASTSALQTTGNTSLATIATNTTGVATAANQTAVIATPGTAAVSKSLQVAGSDGTNARTISTDTSGVVNVNVKSSSVPLDVILGPLNITVVDSGSTSTPQANGQVAITGSPTAGSVALFTVASYQSVEAAATGTWTGTLSSEVSFDGGTTWFTRGLKQVGSAYLASTFTQNFEGGANASGITNYRVRATAAMTGTAVIRTTLSANEGSLIISNPLTLRDATVQSITNTIKPASTAALATDTALVVAVSPNNTVKTQDNADGPVSPGAAAANSQLVGMVYNSTVPAPTNTQQLAMQSDQYGNLQAVLPDLVFTGQAAQTATVNNIIGPSAGSAATQVNNYKSGTIQVVSTAAGGTYIIEGSNDNVNFNALIVWTNTTVAVSPVSTAQTASSGSLIYTFPVTTSFIRMRIVTTITGGSIQAFTRFSQSAWNNQIVQVSSVSGNVGVTAWSSTTDQASGAIITTTTSATKTLSTGTIPSFTVNITATSGTNQTYDFKLQSSADGTVWTDYYQAPRQTGISSFVVPPIYLQGLEYRYIETIGGSSPSFTRTITSNRNSSAGIYERNVIDRTLLPATASSTSQSLNVDGCSSLGFIGLLGAGGTGNIQIALDGSDDNVNWVQGLTFVNVVAASTVPFQCCFNLARFRFIRARTVTAQTSATLSYITLYGTFNDVQVPMGKKIVATVQANPNTFSTSYTQLVASTIADTHGIETFDTSGLTYIIGVGASASEVTQLYVGPGGSFPSQQSLFIPAGSRIAIKTLTGTPTSGNFFFNAYSGS